MCHTGDGAVVRNWSGATRADQADEHLDYLERTGFADFQRTLGNQALLALRRHIDHLSDVTLLTLWRSEAAIRECAGSGVERAVCYAEDERFLVRRDSRARHSQVALASHSQLHSRGRERKLVLNEPGFEASKVTLRVDTPARIAFSDDRQHRRHRGRVSLPRYQHYPCS
jgi:heme-degrading monooxygenase HmoA